MKRSALTQTVSELCTRPLGTVNDYFDELQSASLITKGSRGRNGGAEMLSSDRTNLLLACALDHPRGVHLGDSVRKLRSLETYVVRQTHRLDLDLKQGFRGACDFVDGLSIGPLDGLGDALDCLVDDFSSGAFQAWAANSKVALTLEFSRGMTAALLVIDKDERGVYFGFGTDEEFRPASTGIDRVVRVYKTVFERLAANDTT
jgi:hypothetical protein